MSLELLKRQAERGQAQAQFELYCLFREGGAVDLDLAEARRYLVAGARQRHRRAMRALAFAYQFGRAGFPRHQTQALRWYRRLVAKLREDAAQGDADAQGFFAVRCT